jgi:hypothetical protein
LSLQNVLAQHFNLAGPRWHLPTLRHGRLYSFLSRINPLSRLLSEIQLLSSDQSQPIDALREKVRDFDFDQDPEIALRKALEKWDLFIK